MVKYKHFFPKIQSQPITGHTGDNPSTLIHQNRQHGKRINDLIEGKWRLQWKSNQVMASELKQARWFLRNPPSVQVGKIKRSSVSKNKYLAVINFKSPILPTRFGSEDIFLFPPLLDIRFDLAQTVTTREALVSTLAQTIQLFFTQFTYQLI